MTPMEQALAAFRLLCLEFRDVPLTVRIDVNRPRILWIDPRRPRIHRVIAVPRVVLLWCEGSAWEANEGPIKLHTQEELVDFLRRYCTLPKDPLERLAAVAEIKA